MKINQPIKTAALFVSILAVFTTNSGVANATLLGGKWAASGTFSLYYGYSGAHRYNGNAWQGAKNWSDTPTRANIKPWPGTPYRVHIDVVDNWSGDTIWGATILSPCETCTYKKATVHLFARSLDKESDFTRTKVTTHEFGHALGLAHPPSTKTSVMKQGKLSYNKPQSYDVSELKRRYP